MIVEASVCNVAIPVPPQGQHELAWSYILDAIFADAFRTGQGRLDVWLPHEGLFDEVRLRADLSGRRGVESGRAMAFLGGMQEIPVDVRRLYLLAFGGIAPMALRRSSRAPSRSRWRKEDHLSTYTVKAMLWGIPIRLAGAARRPDLVDRATFAMRRDFASGSDPMAYYQLTTWSRM